MGRRSGVTCTRVAVVTAAAAAVVLSLPGAAVGARAPFRFAGTTSQNFKVRFQIPYSFVGVRKFVIGWEAKCQSGAILDGASQSIGTLRFNRAGPGWNVPGRYRETGVNPDYSASNGRQLTFQVSLRNAGRTRRDDVTGVWKAVATVLDPSTGLSVDTCRTGRVTWRADLL
jgi:hypothetical protein